MDGYTLYRTDRAGGRSHGGVALYIRSDLTALELVKHSNNYCESQVIEVIELEMLLINIYRPPNSPKQLFEEVLDRCQMALEEVILKEATKTKTILMLGDYNFPFIRWPCKTIYTREEDQVRSSEKEQGLMIIDWTGKNFLEQIILTPTTKEGILDLVFTNNEDIINRYKVTVNNRLSDHNTLNIYLNIDEDRKDYEKKNRYPNEIFEYDLLKGTEGDWIKYETMMEKKAEDPEKSMKEKTTDEQVVSFIEKVDETVKLLFDKKREFRTGKEKGEETSRRNKIPRQIRTNMKKKSSISKKILSSKSATKTLKLMTKLQKIENDLKESYDKMRSKKEQEAVKKIKKNAKFFYSFATKSAKIKNKVGPLMDEEGEIKKDSESMANILRKQYESVFIDDTESILT